MNIKEEAIRLCAWCKKLCVDKWALHPLPKQTEVKNITHGICPDCRDKELKSK